MQVRQLGAEAANVVTYTVVINARNPNGRLLPGMTANVEITADRVADVLRLDYDATRFQPPKEIAGGDARGDASAMARADKAAANGGPAAAKAAGGGAPRRRPAAAAAVAACGPGGRRRNSGRCLKTAGVDDARVEKIMTELRTEMQKAMAVDRRAPGRSRPAGAAASSAAAASARRPASLQQQQSSERFAKMQQTQETVFRRNLNAAGICRRRQGALGDAVAEARHRLQAQRQGRA